MKYIYVGLILGVLWCSVGYGEEPESVILLDYKVGDKVRTIPRYTEQGLGYVEGYVLNIFETPDNTYVPPHSHTIFLAVVDFGGSVYGNGIKTLSVNWLRKFNKETDPPSTFEAADRFRETGQLSKPLNP